MDTTASGMNRYFAEYLFHRAVKVYPEWKKVSHLRASQGRAARARLDEILAAKGASMDQIDPAEPGVLLESIDEVLSQTWPDYTPLFAGPRTQSRYDKIRESFSAYTGASGRVPRGGARLPVSPFDPRWSNRETVMERGTEMLAIPDEVVSMEVTGQDGYDRLAQLPPDRAFDLVSLEVPEGWNAPRRVGKSNTMADVTGLSALRPYMSAAEYREMAPWVLAGASEPDPESPGGIKGHMTPESLARATAVLDYLDDNGIDYKIAKDRPGQLVARPTESRMEIRIAGAGRDGAWIGRSYDNGVVTRYSSAQRDGWYEPSPAEAVDLVRVAMGEPVARFDGRPGFIGQAGPRDLDQVTQTQHSFHLEESAVRMEARPGLRIRRDATTVTEPMWFRDEQVAQGFLADAVDSAAANLASAVDAEGLIELAREHSLDPDYVPEFAGVPEDVQVLKQEYWKLLTDPDSGVVLLDPGVTRAEVDPETGQLLGAQAMRRANPEDQVREHAQLVTAAMVGTFEPDEQTGLRFDPVVVSQYMDSQYGIWRNNENLVAACGKAGITADELRGDAYYNAVVADNLLEFDADSAIDISEHPNEMVQRLGQRARDAIERNAADVTSMQIDDSGVVRWTARRRVGEKDNLTPHAKRDVKREVSGQFGQIFAPGKYGEVVTAFAGSENFSFVPGYEAYVVNQKPGEDLTLEERTRLRDYEQSMGRAIDQTVSRDIVSSRSEVGRPTSLNATVRRLAPSSERHPEDFFDELDDPQMSQADRSFRLAQAATSASRVRYPSAMAEGSNALAYRRAERDDRFDRLNDNDRNWLLRTGMRNINELDRQAGRGLFDPMATGTDGNQGLVRYLTPGTRVHPDGTVSRSDTPDARSGVLAHEYLQAAAYNPADRQIKAAADASRALHVDPGTTAAMAEIGGWNYEDGIVVSEEFAARNTVIGADGQPRPLMIGDKLSDMSNNKGVISLVVDRYTSAEAAADLGISRPVQMFADNPGLDVVMSPYSPISRFNGGTAREMMTGPQDLVLRDDQGAPQTVPGGMGPLNMMITHLTVDSKTTIYDTEAVASGRGRKASSQLAWALQAQGSYEVMRDLYGDNSAGAADVREYLLVLGMDLGPEGEVLPEISTESLQSRRLMAMPEPVYRAPRQGQDPAKVPVEHQLMNKAFGEQLSNSGGLMEIPFPLELADGSTTPASPGGDAGRWVLPVLSASLRVDQDLVGGGVSRHDYTQSYLTIFEQGNRYAEAQRLRDQAAATGDLKTMGAQQQTMTDCMTRAQRSYEAMSREVISRQIESKTNMFKESVMSARQPNSATAVWSPDPRLEVDQVAMNREMALELGVRMMDERTADELGVPWTGVEPDPQDGYVMIWRDPVLRDGALRYMRVVIDNDLTGVAVNPVMVKSMDGDFDGDSVGLVGGLGELAHAEALETLSVEANLLDRGVREEIPVYEPGPDGELVDTGAVREVYPLGLHTGLDIETACKADPQMRPFIDYMTLQANQIREQFDAGQIDRTEFCDRSRAVMAGLSGSVFHDGFASSAAPVALRFDSLATHLRSVQDCYLRGGKGSKSKLEEYSSYLGAKPQFDDSELVVAARDTGAPDPEEFDQKYRGSQAAMAFKTQITGVAGAVSQNAVKLARGQGMVRQACELGYPATQSVLQAKHDPVDAAYRADMITGAVKDLWRGHKMEHWVNPEDAAMPGRYSWSVVRSSDNTPVQATAAEWVEQFRAMYSDSAGMGVDVADEHIEAFAQMLSNERGEMIDFAGTELDMLPEESVPLALDRLTYGGDFDTLKEVASRRERLYSGPAAGFAPRSVLTDTQVRAELERVGVELHSGLDVGISDRDASAETAQFPSRKDTSADFQRRMPRSEWTARHPGWTRTKPETAPAAPVPAGVGAPAAAAAPAQPGQSVSAPSAISDQARAGQRQPVAAPVGPSLRDRVDAAAWSASNGSGGTHRDGPGV